MLGKSDRNILRAGAPWFAPGLALDYMARHAIDFWLTTEDLPDPRQPRHGRPPRRHPPRQDLPQHRAAQAPAGASSRTCSGPLGCHRDAAIPRWSVLSQRIPIAGIAHQCGTVRFGTDPRQSALDVNCKAHDLDNLYVVDTSFFPSSSAVNPALTAMANALRVGDHLLDRLGAPSALTSATRKSERSDPTDPRTDARATSEGHRGIVVGLVAAWVKALSEPRLQAAAERILPPSPAQKREVGADPSRAAREHAPRGGRRAHGRRARPRRTDRPSTVAPAKRDPLRHGRGRSAIAYAAVATAGPRRAGAAARSPGWRIYAGTHGSLLPALGVQRPPWQLAPAAVAWESTSHAVFGTAWRRCEGS